MLLRYHVVVKDSARFSSPIWVVLQSDPLLTVDVVGERAKLLQRLIDVGVPVPESFVFTQAGVAELWAANHFIDLLGAAFARTNWDDPAQVAQTSRELAQAIEHFHFPEEVAKALYDAYAAHFSKQFLAVKPSLLHTDYPTDHLSDLAVQGEANLAESLLRVLARAYLPEHLPQRYREWQAQQPVPKAVLVQTMFPAASSGVALTVDPETGDHHRVVVYATWGVSQLMPDDWAAADRFVIDTRTGQIIEKQIALKREFFAAQLDHLRAAAVPAAKQKQAAISDTQAQEIAHWAAAVGRLSPQPRVLEWLLTEEKPARLLVCNVQPFKKSISTDKAGKTAEPLASEHRSADVAEKRERASWSPQLSASSANRTRTKILAWVCPTDKIDGKAQPYTQIPADGIGVLDSQGWFKQLQQHPQLNMNRHQEESLFAEIFAHCQAAKAAVWQPPLLYRAHHVTSADLLALPGGDAFETAESNTWLGYRGGMRVVRNDELFAIEAAAVAAAHNQLRLPMGIVVPFVRSGVEFALIKKQLLRHSEAAVLAQNVWLECDTPANIFELPEYLIHHPAGLLIDVTSIWALALGIDPTNREVLAQYPMESVLIQQVLAPLRQVTRQLPLPIHFLCTAVNPAVIEAAVGFAADAVVVKPAQMAVARQLVEQAEGSRS